MHKRKIYAIRKFSKLLTAIKKSLTNSSRKKRNKK